MSPPAMDKIEENKVSIMQTNGLHTDDGNVDPTEARFTDFCKVFIVFSELFFFLFLNSFYECSLICCIFISK